jgi:DNA polymerase-3 subunit delta'
MSDFKQVIGQEQAIDLLEQAIKRDRIAPAYLFTGTPGIGRCLTARCFSQGLLCLNLTSDKKADTQHRILAGNHPDLLWVEPTYLHQGQRITPKEAIALGVKRKAPPQIRIEQIREITQFLSRPPLESSRAVVVIEDAHTMTESAGNALLKNLRRAGGSHPHFNCPQSAYPVTDPRFSMSTDPLLPTHPRAVKKSAAPQRPGGCVSSD